MLLPILLLLHLAANALCGGDTTWRGPVRANCSTQLARLPQKARPHHYNLLLETDLELLQFRGQVEIHLEVANATNLLDANQLALHVDRDMVLDEVAFEFMTGNRIEVREVCRQGAPSDQVVVVSLARDLTLGSSGKLRLNFSRPLRRDLLGYYNSTYGLPKPMAATQFQTDHARSAFPCFDEPAMKATFNVTLVHPQDRQALANTDPISSREEQTKLVESFATTPLMSTYLVAFVVGQFNYLERAVSGIRLRAYGKVGEQARGQFALDQAARSLPLMEDYFGVKFPLAKVDLVPVPDSKMVAMENWGLVTFKESSLLVDGEHNSQERKNVVTQTVVHELAHQWFGNLVTMDWWNDLWLNEAFATWVEYNMTATLFPELQYDYVFLLEPYTWAHLSDSDSSAVPVAYERLNDSIQLDSLLSPIVYYKGATLIAQLHDLYLGPETFKASMRHYIKAHAYGNTKSSDLWHSMELNSNQKPVRELMESWLLQPGHPLINVTLVANNTLHLSQQRFSQEPLSATELSQRWIIPVRILVADETRLELVEATMRPEEKETLVQLPGWFTASGKQWLKLNANSTGLYVVAYPSELLQLMEPAVRSRRMPPKDRLNLLIEALMLYQAQLMSPQELEALVGWFAQEDHWAVLESLQYAFNKLPPSDNIGQLVESLFGRLFNDTDAFGASGGESAVSYLEQRSKRLILRSLVYQDHKATIRRALGAFDNWQRTRQRPPLYLVTPICQAVVEAGTQAQFEQLLALASAAGNGREERQLMMEPLAEVEGADRLERVWLLLEDETNFTLDDKMAVLKTMLNTPTGCALVNRLLSQQRAKLVELNRGQPVGELEDLSGKMCAPPAAK